MNRRTHDHEYFGTVSIENGWVPAPGYVLRRQRILATLGPMRRGRLVEVGCGAGALVRDLHAMGFACSALEMGEQAREIAKRICADRPGLEIHAAPRPDWAGGFEYVLAFEVLEHIEDDRSAVKQWASWLAPRGKLILSVPAHPERWNVSDVWAGHFRRYTRASLEAVLAQAGLSVEHFETYGFPLINLIEPVRALHHGRQLRRRGKLADDKHEGSVHSGIDRTLETRLYPLQSSPVGVGILKLCARLQEMFSERELGTGYLVTASLR
jgi:SAM-dependent methyltransferase